MTQGKRSFLHSLGLAAALAASVVIATVAGLEAQRVVVERRVYDRDHRDYHPWDEREDRAYRTYLREQRREYRVYVRLKRPEQRQYWRWRHEHPERY